MSLLLASCQVSSRVRRYGSTHSSNANINDPKTIVGTPIRKNTLFTILSSNTICTILIVSMTALSRVSAPKILAHTSVSNLSYPDP